MPDYRYLKEPTPIDEGAKKLGTQLFLQYQDQIVDLLVKGCKLNLEEEVKMFYRFGPKKYKDHYRVGVAPIKKAGLFSHDYIMEGRISIHPRTSFAAEVGAGYAESYAKSTTVFSSNCDEDDWRCFFPTESFLNSTIEAANSILKEDEIELFAEKIPKSSIKDNDQKAVYIFFFHANLGQL